MNRAKVFFCAAAAVIGCMAASAQGQLRLSQVYGGGGNTGATYTNDFIEVFNAGTVAADLTGMSVQYASATGTTWSVTNLGSFMLQPGQYYLVQEAVGAGGTTPLPTPDATGTIAMSGTNGKVALVASTTALSGACPAGVVDIIGYGTANCFETAATAALTNTTAAIRNNGGCVDTGSNLADFTLAAPTPRNTASPRNQCSSGACCSGGSCSTVAFQAACTGVYQGPATSCTPDPCNIPLGSCCAPAGTCTETQQANCAGGSTWTLNGTCSPNICPQPMGACCTGICTDGVTQADCTASSGVWGGANSTCGTFACPGACCIPGCRTCTATTQAGCTALGGNFSQGAPCSTFPNNACDPAGACCRGTGCASTSQTECVAQAGTWGGAGSTCAAFCPDTANIGACCFDRLSCRTLTAAQCTAEGGTFQGLLTVCPNAACAIFGTCCLADGRCLSTTLAYCTAQGGTFAGTGAACLAGSCPTGPAGACCIAGVCSAAASPSACANLFGTFISGASCSPDPCLSPGVEITRFDFDSNVVGTPARNLSFSAMPNNSASNGAFTCYDGAGFDVFGVTDRTVNADFADAGGTDNVGILDPTQTGKIFGVEDLTCPGNGNASGTATWMFQVDSFFDVFFEVDIAADGDFENHDSIPGVAPDAFTIRASRGGTPATIFVGQIGEGMFITYDYSGTGAKTLKDPMTLNGAPAQNRWITVRAMVPPSAGNGPVLTLTLTAQQDGGGELYGLDNIVVRGTAAPVNQACCFANGSCLELAPAQCTFQGGTPQGPATTCTPNICPQPVGACCVGALCTTGVTQALCTGLWNFVNSCAILPGPPHNFCCPANFNRDAVKDIPDIFSALAAFFALNPAIDWNGNTVVEVADFFGFLSDWFLPC